MEIVCPAFIPLLLCFLELVEGGVRGEESIIRICIYHNGGEGWSVLDRTDMPGHDH